IALERTAKAGEVCRPETFLALAVKDVDIAELGGEPVRQLPGSVPRVCLDDEHAHVLVAESAEHRLEVLALVVGGQTDDGLGHPHGRIFNAWPELCLATWMWRSSWSSWPTCSRS